MPLYSPGLMTKQAIMWRLGSAERCQEAGLRPRCSRGAHQPTAPRRWQASLRILESFEVHGRSESSDEVVLPSHAVTYCAWSLASAWETRPSAAKAFAWNNTGCKKARLQETLSNGFATRANSALARRSEGETAGCTSSWALHNP